MTDILKIGKSAHPFCIEEKDVAPQVRSVLTADEDCAILTVCTDEVRWMSLTEFEIYMTPERLTHLLELRAHSPLVELHALRTAIAKPFLARFKNDALPMPDGFTVDEVHRLDIDRKHRDTEPNNRRYRSIAGGAYTLPVKNADRFTLRNYYVYDGNGIAHFNDFRIVGFGDLTREAGD